LDAVTFSLKTGTPEMLANLIALKKYNTIQGGKDSEQPSFIQGSGQD
jgi:hypothetical protein